MTDHKLTNKQWREFQAIPEQGYSHRAWVDARITEAVSAARTEALKDALPEGAKWFPTEGGFMWKGEAYYPASYVLTRSDIDALRTEEREKALAAVTGVMQTAGGYAALEDVAAAIRAVSAEQEDHHG